MGQFHPQTRRVQPVVAQQTSKTFTRKDLIEKLRQVEIKLADLLDNAQELEDNMDIIYGSSPNYKDMNAANSLSKLSQSIAYAWRGSRLTARLLEDSSPQQADDF